MNKILSALLLLLLLIGKAQGQSQNVDNLVPTSPTAFQFLKYDELPVSEYTGIPDISVPLYEIAVDGVRVPLELTYHAGGIRVNQEASWVGLGWDLSIGSIVQIINDEDDFGVKANGSAYEKILPDLHGNPIPSGFPYRYNYPFDGDGLLWSNPYTKTDNIPDYVTYKVATDYFVPVEEEFNTRREQLFTGQETDSEPDIFKANFLGYSFNFIRDFKTGSYKILNKKGYKICKIDDYWDGHIWKVVVPSGETYYFEESSVVYAETGTEGFGGAVGTGYRPSSKVWMLTKVITNNLKEIVFNYSRTAEAEGFPNYFEKIQKATYVGTYNQPPVNGEYEFGYAGMIMYTSDGEFYTRSQSKENYLYLSSIIFPQGRIDFTTTSRSDILRAKKLSKIEIKNGQALSADVVNYFDLGYGYFEANTGGNGYSYDTDKFGNTANLRLKLARVQEKKGPKHNFYYNSTLLPKKNSFAQDFWGYYNGQLSNSSLAPNPSRLGKPDLGDNGNNRSANLAYIKAATLEKITYPSGGSASFEYELNAFDNYWVPDFSTSTNEISHGHGLRIRLVTFLEKESVESKKVKYTYSGGKAILPVEMFRSYPVKTIEITNGDWANASVRQYQVEEINPNGLSSASQFGSIKGVGYDKVIKEELDLSGATKGRTETYFHNTPDKITHSANSFSQLSAILPAIKHINKPANGLVKEQLVYSRDNRLLKKIENSYSNILSEFYYGARIFGYTNMVYPYCDNWDNRSCIYYVKAQNLIGYYPIYDLETLLDENRVTEYFPNGTVTRRIENRYDGYNQLKSSFTYYLDNQSNDSYLREDSYFYYPYNYPDDAIMGKLTQINRLSELVKKSDYKYDLQTGTFRHVYFKKVEYLETDGKILEKKVTVKDQPSPSDNKPSEIFFDLYDSGSANLLQYRKESEVPVSLLWGYDKNLVIAEAKNAKYEEIFYDNFEYSTGSAWTGTGFSYAIDKKKTGKRSGKIENTSTSEVIIHSTKWLNVAFPAPKKFTYSGWVFSSSPSAQIYLFMKREGESGYYTYVDNVQTTTTGKWVYLEKEYEVPADVVKMNIRLDNNGNGNVWFDDIRLYPSDSQISTFTHEPLVGISSVTDTNGSTTFYEYDWLGRLITVKDKDGNIIEHYQYNFRK